MKIIMKEIATAIDKDGNRYVFGPAGREYSTDEGMLTEKMADSLLKNKSAELVKSKVKTQSKPLEVPNHVTE